MSQKTNLSQDLRDLVSSIDGKIEALDHGLTTVEAKVSKLDGAMQARYFDSIRTSQIQNASKALGWALGIRRSPSDLTPHPRKPLRSCIRALGVKLSEATE